MSRKAIPKKTRLALYEKYNHRCGYGDNYYENEDGEMICRCFECPFFNSGGDFYE